MLGQVIWHCSTSSDVGATFSVALLLMQHRRRGRRWRRLGGLHHCRGRRWRRWRRVSSDLLLALLLDGGQLDVVVDRLKDGFTVGGDVLQLAVLVRHLDPGLAGSTRLLLLVLLRVQRPV